MRNGRVLMVCTVALLLWGSVASAQAELGFNGIGGRIGLVSPENIDATLAFGVFADLGKVHPDIALEAYINYWSKSMGVTGVSEASFRDITIGGKAEYRFALENPKIKPFVGGGLSLHLYKTEVDVPAINIGGFSSPATTLDDSSSKIGIDIGGGVRVNMSDTIDFVGDAWYSIVSDVSQVAIMAGILYKL